MAIKVNLKTTKYPITIKSSAGVGVTRLDRLNDVEEGLSPEDGSTLVYNQQTDKYIVKKLQFDNIEDDLDGGSF